MSQIELIPNDAYNQELIHLTGRIRGQTAVLTNMGAWGGLLITLVGGALGLGLYTATHNNS